MAVEARQQDTEGCEGLFHNRSLSLEMFLLCVGRSPLAGLQFLNVRRRELWRLDGDGELINLAVEGERGLVILVVHTGSSVGTDIKRLVGREDNWDRLLHCMRINNLAIHFQRASAAKTNAAGIVESEGSKAQSVVLVIELDGVFARGEWLRTGPLHALEVHEVPGEYRLALDYVEAVTAKASAIRHNHALRVLGYFHFRRHGEGSVQHVRCCATGNSGDRLTGIGVHVAPGRQAGTR